jgi:hypothetical protein
VTTIARAILEFIAYRVDGKTERQLVSDAQDLFLEDVSRYDVPELC